MDATPIHIIIVLILAFLGLGIGVFIVIQDFTSMIKRGKKFEEEEENKLDDDVRAGKK